MAEQGDISGLLQRLADGDPDVEDQLYRLVLPELKRRAHRLIARERKGHPLQPTDLLITVFRRVAAATRDGDQVWRNRTHFYAFFSKRMRWYLIDYVRRHRKRLNAKHVPVEGQDNVIGSPVPSPEQAILVHELLFQMAQVHKDWVSIVEMKFFADFKDHEIAEALGIPLRSMQRKWEEARKWLFLRIRGRNC
jgi:RNA polymerase sigma factor (TIGR02999 family)